jgi:Zn-dependent protease with chaperone function
MILVLVTAIENFVLFSTVLALVCFAITFTAHVLAARSLWHPRPDTLARLYTRALVVPPVVAAWLVIAALLPEWWLGQIAFNGAHPAPHHELHLFGDLTAKVEPMLAYMTFLFIAGVVVFAAWSGWRTRVRVGRIIGQLQMNAETPSQEQIALVEECASEYNLHVGLVTSSYPFSFVWGFQRSHLILSTGLLDELSTAELRGVLEHEAAHHVRRDNVIKLILSLCAYSSLAFLLSRLILRWRALEVEMICDEVAVSRTGAPLEIANALIKLRRQISIGHAAAEATVGSGFVSNELPGFERRVHRLIDFVDEPPYPRMAVLTWMPNARAVICAAIFMSTLAVLTLLSPLAVHKAAESLIQILK